MDFFSAIVTGKEIERRKPYSAGRLKCARALGVEPGQSVYVADAPIDVQASRAAGMASAAVLSGAGISASLSIEGLDRMIDSHARLPEILDIV